MKDSPKKIRLATIWLDGCSGCHMSIPVIITSKTDPHSVSPHHQLFHLHHK